eukprot:gene22688-biopygen17754
MYTRGDWHFDVLASGGVAPLSTFCSFDHSRRWCRGRIIRLWGGSRTVGAGPYSSPTGGSWAYGGGLRARATGNVPALQVSGPYSWGPNPRHMRGCIWPRRRLQ